MALLDELFGGTPPTPEDVQALVQKLVQLQQQPQMGTNEVTVSNPGTLAAVEQFRRAQAAQAAQTQGDGAAEAQRLNQGVQERAAANRMAESNPQRAPGGLEQLGVFLAGGSQGDGLLSAIGHGISNVSAKSKSAETENMTARALMAKGLDQETATLAVRNPEIMKQMIPMFSRSAPQTIDVPGPFGQMQSLYWDPATKKYRSATSLIEGQPTATVRAQQAAQAAEQGAMPAVAESQAAASNGVPAAPAAKAVGPNMTEDGQHVIGNAVAKAPDGYVHKLAPNGTGYLYTPEGRPVFESKAEVDARGKNTEKHLEAADKQVKAGEQVAGAIDQLTRLPMDFGKQALERAIGPWSATDPNPASQAGIWGTGISVDNLGRNIARGIGEVSAKMEGGAAPTEVRDRIETVTKNLAAVMKPLVRAPGEGAWSDKDQANLEAQIGMLTRARSAEEYERRLSDIRENISKVFKLQVPKAGEVTRSANAPITAEDDVTGIEQLMQGLSPEKLEILRRMGIATPSATGGRF
ncbi:MAG: hypothetical protein ACKVP3_23650 [Hyphomicrobiaceae bacterium]